MPQKSYMLELGSDVLNMGYEPIPLVRYKKFPSLDNWQSIKINKKTVEGWKANGKASSGIGIRAKFTPMLDLDIMNLEARNRMIRWSDKNIGTGMMRVGQPPKIGIVFRSEEPFKKVQSKAYRDPDGKKAQLEFLGDGQQFAAFGVHPDTKKPYRWLDKGMDPSVYPAEDLATVTQELAEAAKAYFEKMCEELGWPRYKDKKGKGTAVATVPDQRDDFDESHKERCGYTLEEVRERVERLPNDDTVDYEDGLTNDIIYTRVIFAIFHETEGSEEGRDIAEAWSAKSPKHEVEVGRFFKLWGSADAENRDNPVTFRYILKLLKEDRQEENKEKRKEHVDSLDAVGDIDGLKNLIEVIKKTKFDDLDLGLIAGALAKAYKRILNAPCTQAQALKKIAHEPEGSDIPTWVRPWVYILHSKHFYNRETGLEIDREAFDAAFTRYLDGYPASTYALNTVKIKTYYMTMYKPDDEPEFWFEGHPCINTYSDRLMPETPRKLTKGDKRAIGLVTRHFENLLPDARDRALQLSYMAYVVQTRQRPNWAVALQGVDGDGKSLVFNIMGAVLGGTRNAAVLDPQQLEDKYTGWSVGKLFLFIEELRLQGHNRFDILNKIKPFISNQVINVHKKGIDSYTAYNTTAYMAVTNFGDALPLDDNDRRWLILKSQWQHASQLRKFLSENPDYFKNLFDAINNHAGALRKFLMEYELHEEFDPKGRAPITRWRQEMIDDAKSDIQKLVEEMIEDDVHPRIGGDLVISSALMVELKEASDERISGRTVGALLKKMGYVKIPTRVRLDPEQTTKDTIWARDTSHFNGDFESVIKRRVLKFLRKRQVKISRRNEV